MRNKAFKNFFIFILLSIILSLFTSCENLEKSKLMLDTNWVYSLNPDFSDPEPISVDDFRRLYTKLENREGYIYLKTTFILPKDLSEEKLSVFMGIIYIASEISLNGTIIGGSGHFPPLDYSQCSISESVYLPSELLKDNYQNNELVIKLWCNGYGQISETPFITEYSQVNQVKNRQDFFNSTVYLISSFILLIISVMYLFLYFINKDKKQYLSFALMNLCSFLYLGNISFGELNFIIDKSYSILVFEKFFNCIVPTLTAHFAVSFIRDFLGETDSKNVSIYRIILVSCGCMSCLFTADMNSCLKMEYLNYALIALHMFHAVKLIIDNIFIKHNKHVFTLLLGFSPVLLSLVLEVLIQITKQHSYLFIVVLGWQLVIYFFLGILLIDFTRNSNELKVRTEELKAKNTEIEDINENLENLVTERTKALKDINDILQYKQVQNEKEIELATFVQQSFYKHEQLVLKDWEISYYFKALQGVSGDLYDIYYDNDKLKGLGIFDVSGHGIASGLVTMLVKNIINQEFYIGSEDKLEDVMSIINNRIIDEKGSIENYLTGILIRVNKNELEIVNAGHPECILYNCKSKTAEFVSKGSDECCGAIGIPYLPVHFETNRIKMNSGDSLLLYTDGITECMNTKREEYTSDRLLHAFKGTVNLPIDEQIQAILHDLNAFISNSKITDDISYIILRKK